MTCKMNLPNQENNHSNLLPDLLETSLKKRKGCQYDRGHVRRLVHATTPELKSFHVNCLFSLKNGVAGTEIWPFMQISRQLKTGLN